MFLFAIVVAVMDHRSFFLLGPIVMKPILQNPQNPFTIEILLKLVFFYRIIGNLLTQL